jgi:hypothetical protein
MKDACGQRGFDFGPGENYMGMSSLSYFFQKNKITITVMSFPHINQSNPIIEDIILP